MHASLKFLPAFILTLALTGCHSSPADAGVQGSAGGSQPVSAKPLPTGFTTAEIHDPTLNNVLADTMTIPAGWKLEGTILEAPCTTLPWPVYRTYSPDGLTEIRQMPALGWRWSRYASQQGCLDLKTTLSAADFLKHFITTLPGGIHIIGPAPVPAAFSQWAQNFAGRLNAQSAGYGAYRSIVTADTAALHIQTHNGTFLLDQRLKAVVVCSVNNNAASPLAGGSCWARVDALRAPAGHLDALVALVDNNQLPKPQENPVWQQAVLARDRERTAGIQRELSAMQRAQAETSRAMFEQFMATSRQNFLSFQAQQEDKFNHFQANMAAQRQLRDNDASDWVDFALDRQTMAGPDGLSKVSSDYTHVWTSQTGNQEQWFMTNDSNANPNGALDGAWTENTKVHGNGQPIN